MRDSEDVCTLPVAGPHFLRNTRPPAGSAAPGTRQRTDRILQVPHRGPAADTPLPDRSDGRRQETGRKFAVVCDSSPVHVSVHLQAGLLALYDACAGSAFLPDSGADLFRTADSRMGETQGKEDSVESIIYIRSHHHRLPGHRSLRSSLSSRNSAECRAPEGSHQCIVIRHSRSRRALSVHHIRILPYRHPIHISLRPAVYGFRKKSHPVHSPRGRYAHHSRYTCTAPENLGQGRKDIFTFIRSGGSGGSRVPFIQGP